MEVYEEFPISIVKVVKLGKNSKNTECRLFNISLFKLSWVIVAEFIITCESNINCSITR